MPDFQTAAFRDLYNAYFGTDDLGMPLHPVFMYQKYLREHIKQRQARARADGGEAD
jgi:hypothetical protein